MNLKFQSHIFKPIERTIFLEERWNLLGWMSILLFFLFLILEVYWLAFTIMFFLSMTCYGLAISRWNILEKPKGSFPLSLTISLCMIQIGDISFPMDALKITKLICYDYRGRSTMGYVFAAQYPMKSNGTWNHLWIVHERKEYRLRFLIESEPHAQPLTEIKTKLGIV